MKTTTRLAALIGGASVLTAMLGAQAAPVVVIARPVIITPRVVTPPPRVATPAPSKAATAAVSPHITPSPVVTPVYPWWMFLGSHSSAAKDCDKQRDKGCK
jgi:hypothetical protein